MAANVPLASRSIRFRRFGEASFGGLPSAPGGQDPPGHPARNPHSPGETRPRIAVNTLIYVANAAVRTVKPAVCLANAGLPAGRPPVKGFTVQTVGEFPDEHPATPPKRTAMVAVSRDFALTGQDPCDEYPLCASEYAGPASGIADVAGCTGGTSDRVPDPAQECALDRRGDDRGLQVASQARGRGLRAVQSPGSGPPARGSPPPWLPASWRRTRASGPT